MSIFPCALRVLCAVIYQIPLAWVWGTSKLAWIKLRISLSIQELPLHYLASLRFLFALSIGGMLIFQREWGIFLREDPPGRDYLLGSRENKGWVRRPGILKSQVNQPDPCCVPNQFYGAANAELFHNAGAMIFNCFGTDEKSFRDFLDGKALRQDKHDLLFS